MHDAETIVTECDSVVTTIGGLLKKILNPFGNVRW